MCSGWRLSTKWEPGEKSQRKEDNQQQTQPSYDAGPGNRTRATMVGGKCFLHCTTLVTLIRSSIHVLLKTSNGILQFLSFDWLTGNGSYTIDHKHRSRYASTKTAVSSNIPILLGVFNKTIIPLALVGYEIANSSLSA